MALDVSGFRRRARAQDAADQAVVDKIVQMNKKALDDYDTLEWDSAKRTLLEALVAGKKAGLDNHPVMARTYVHLGCVYVTGLKDRQKGVQSFVRAIEIDPTIKIEQTMTDPELEEAFAEAAKQVKPRAGAGGPPRRRPPPPAARAAQAEGPRHGGRVGGAARRSGAGPSWRATTPPPAPERRAGATSRASRTCPSTSTRSTARRPTRSRPTRPSSCAARSPTNLGVAKVFLMYRLPGQRGVRLGRDGAHAQGLVPGQAPEEGRHGQVGAALLRGPQRRPASRSSRTDAPTARTSILIREEAAAEEAEAEAAEASGRKQADDTEENPLEERNEAAGPRLYLGKVDKSKIGLDTRYGNRAVVDRHRRRLGLRLRQGQRPRDAPRPAVEVQRRASAGRGSGTSRPRSGSR